MYSADALLEQGFEVDVFDKLPVPFGLVRYGVAPDHLSIRSVRDTLDQVWNKPGIRFVGNVEIGKDISVDELRGMYSAVVLTYGASADRRLGVDGEDLDGSVAATDFVAWYTGHPDYRGPNFGELLPRIRSVAVIGVGNVAVDVVRVLSKSAGELAETDMPRHVLDTLRDAPIETVYLVGRRGPVQASFTTKELKELGELQEADVRISKADLELDEWSQAQLAENKVATRNVAAMRGWTEREARAHCARTIEMRFFARPVCIEGDNRVERLVLEQTHLTHEGRLEGTGRTDVLEVDMVVRSVGYRGEAMPGVPFDPTSNVIPNLDGRVLDDQATVPGLYVAGWIKRGPTGIIGTNKKCAVGTVASLVEDQQAGLLTDADGTAIDAVLAGRGVQAVDIAGWRAIDAQERERGSLQGRARETVWSREDLLEIASTARAT
jgi:ferredoxin--NADP+ reductase